MVNEIDRLKAELSRNTSVTGSVRTLIESMSQQLRDMADDATELEQLKNDIRNAADTLAQNTQELADAVEDGTDDGDDDTEPPTPQRRR